MMILKKYFLGSSQNRTLFAYLRNSASRRNILANESYLSIFPPLNNMIDENTE